MTLTRIRRAAGVSIGLLVTGTVAGAAVACSNRLSLSLALVIEVGVRLRR